ncbi:hypothetical protein CLAFUW4_02531 [Fulvia fulva]|uniref:Uncharacterized protein n=1 Tax=Passalora fulva TaxID=5499 RepID=A0A9Q8LAX1_PASFU|nr:uncharacterized protein CLAFUR5_02521 [Fulvia fulva]KAK4631646.1 hypothetical protein CLAFUR4_02526 [Fulvia fulva]KAK4633403.1 hypothetical protein CLAFUR0_02530 [Fulvia fulva]UJO14077.1 hypothetical protein CLAFUR5_02521 [Fulvia fulva]WPV11338.1 hypothetical protein CLAFUW4_02531 [Fulvia fulva]WPV25884.1 hypothetical protein CLAFUW7_02531 [Fulvia fulva]
MFRRLPHNLRRPRPEDIARVSDDGTSSAAAAAESNQPATFPRTPTDVLDTIRWLQRASQHRLPNELIKMILHNADYDCIHFLASHNTLVSRFSTGEETPLQPYLATTPLLYLPTQSSSEGGRIRRVTVRATGKDQGWCQNREGGFWSWYELGKNGVNGEQQRGPVWARNAMAKKEPQDHEMVYDAERPEDSSSEVKAWVEDLKNGDAVSIVPMARFKGWSCNVLKASIDVEVEVWW